MNHASNAHNKTVNEKNTSSRRLRVHSRNGSEVCESVILSLVGLERVELVGRAGVGQSLEDARVDKRVARVDLEEVVCAGDHLRGVLGHSVGGERAADLALEISADLQEEALFGQNCSLEDDEPTLSATAWAVSSPGLALPTDPGALISAGQ